MIDSSPKSPRPGLSRTPTSGTSTPDKRSSVVSPFPTTIISPSRPEMSSIMALGESRWLDEGEGEGRARRELSVIDERDGNSVIIKDVTEEADQDGARGADEIDGQTEREDDVQGESDAVEDTGDVSRDDGEEIHLKTPTDENELSTPNDQGAHTESPPSGPGDSTDLDGTNNPSVGLLKETRVAVAA